MLERFVKFTTGSSKLPYETKSVRVYVHFMKGASVKSLPIAHTCTLELEVNL